MQNYELLEFYKSYPVNHWCEKLALLKNYIDNYDSVKETLQKGLMDVDDEKYIKMLKAEIHFTYFQMIEALFELIFAVEKRDDKNLWYYLSFSSWKKNYKRIETIAKGNTSFLHNLIDIGNNQKIQFIIYVFYFSLNPHITESEMKKNLEVIENAIRYFARDFNDREEYNAYKHTLRFFQSPVKLTFYNEETRVAFYQSRAENTFTILEKDEKKQLISVTKAFNPDRDFDMGMICYQLILNIIITRKLYFFKSKEPEPIHYFHKYDLLTINSPKDNLIRTTKTVFWEK
ncbi:hypothetical protein LCGC14_2324290 [marine sediment metagenome]|uniref:Uncharacterized protein n=1 Tax=marine sediment metagenome TaxID=412755 RepID=A0A0F9EUA1_9ZZZZ